MRTVDLLIIGGGSAGMAAAIEAKKLGVSDVLIIEKDNYLGGILNQCIHNGFGLVEFKEELTGPEYLARFVKQVEELNIEYKLSTFVMSITIDKIVTYSNSIEGTVVIKAKSIIFATGCFERTAGQIALNGDRVSGIISAGSAQKYLNIYGHLVGKNILIYGSGDIGLIMARRLTLAGAKILGVVEINPFSSGLARNIKQCLEDFNIPLYLSHKVTNVKGKSRVEKVYISEIDQDKNIIEGTEKCFDCDTLLLSVGLIPYIPLLVALNPNMINGKVSVYDNLETSIPGIFLCGNSLHVHDIVDYVTSEARVAAKGAVNYLKNKKYGRTISLNKDDHILYALPNLIREDDEVLQIKFRVNSIYKNGDIILKNGDDIILCNKFITLVPSELITLNIAKNRIKDFSKDLKVEIWVK